MAKKKKRKMTKKTGLLTSDDVGSIHSGTNARHPHPVHMQGFKDGMALYSTLIPRRNTRYAKDDPQKLYADAASLVQDGVKLLVAAGGSRSADAARTANAQSIIVTSISNSTRPAANVAGICVRTTELDQDRLKLLHELLPGATKVGVLYDSSRLDLAIQMARLDNMASVLGIQLNWQPVNADGSGTQDTQIDNAFQNWGNNIQAVIVAADPLFNNHIDRIVKTAGGNLRPLPAIYQWREFAEAGGLISYGPNLTLAYKLAGTFVGRIASGDTTVDALPLLPLESYELVINLRTAKEHKPLPITVPPTLIARATDVIV
jgi:putative ABC transport system substrate-binding protein